MKATVESLPKDTITEANAEQLGFAFINILGIINESRTKDQLRERFGNMNTQLFNIEKYFIWGFGTHHMWVKQIKNPDRLIIVEF